MFKHWYRGFRMANSIWMLFIFMCMAYAATTEYERANKLQEKVDRLTTNSYNRYKYYSKHSDDISQETDSHIGKDF